MLFIGIDPGGSGAMAAIDGQGVVVGVVKNVATERDLWNALSGWVRLYPGTYAVVEIVHSMPKQKQGVSSSFKFGRSYGFLRGILVASGVRFSEVAPFKWQTAMRCRTKGDKNVSKARAQQLFPDMQITHAIADALLLAEYARVTWKIVPAASLPVSGCSSQASGSTSACPAGERLVLRGDGQSPAAPSSDPS